MEIKLEHFIKSLKSLEYLVNVQPDSLKAIFDDRLIDGIESGKAQKFEICIELCWKTIKLFLKSFEGIDAKTPKQSVKEYYLAKYLSENDYMLLLKAIDDRNALSHVYREEVFREIVGRFPEYLVVLENVMLLIEKKLKEVPNPNP